MRKYKAQILISQLELFEIEVALTELEIKRKELRARLARLGAGTKVCTKCTEEMPVEQFYRDSQKIDRLSSWCRECIAQRTRERYYVERRIRRAA